MRLIVSYAYWIYFFLVSSVFCCVAGLTCLLTAPFDRNRRLVHRIASLWGYQYLWCNPYWKCEFSGLHHIDRTQTYVLVANHQSFWDIMLLYGIDRHFKWVAKDSVLKIPFIGWNMLLNQYVSVSLSERSSIKRMLNSCRHWLSLGSSILMFPEGTRSHDGEIGIFRDGPFKLACESGVPVIPIVLDGTFGITRKGSVSLNFSGKLKVKALPPLHPDDFNLDPRALRVAAQQQMTSALSSMRLGGDA